MNQVGHGLSQTLPTRELLPVGRTNNPIPILIFAVAALALRAGDLAEGSKQDTSWHIPSRPLTAPAGASDVLREMIMGMSAPDVAAIRGRVPRDAAQWKALVASRDADMAANAAALAGALEVSVERDSIDGVVVRRVTPDNVDPKHEDRVFLHLHGGAYVLNGGDAGTVEAVVIAHRTRIRVISIDYRMPPDDPFPAAVDDVVTVYRRLLRGRAATSIAMGGTSAGGGLTLAATHKLIELGIDVPGALFAGSPWADLTKTGDTHFINEGIDHVLGTYNGVLEAAARLYAGERDLKDPLISPVYGDFHGFPPMYLVTGTRDLFLSDTARTHRKLRTAGVVAELNVYEGMSHGDYLFALEAPESHEVFGELSAFLLRHLR